MREALKDFVSSVKVGGKKITNLRFAEDVVLIAGSMNELQDLVNKVNVASNWIGLTLNASKTKVKISRNETESDNQHIMLNNTKVLKL